MITLHLGFKAVSLRLNSHPFYYRFRQSKPGDIGYDGKDHYAFGFLLFGVDIWIW